MRIAPKITVALDRSIGRWIYAAHGRLYRLTDGAIGHRSMFGPILLLTTTGRRSGQPRTTPLLYLPDGEDFIVVASNGGRPAAPLWLRNLEVDPAASVQVGRRHVPVRARILSGNEAAALWSRLNRHYAGWQDYQSLTPRTIPPVRLTPAERT